ncbi:MAG: toprim domain-containing protein [Alphaproteobacteria bacterium]|nr:toprim domain-containing protein [Alphaproteobacteria bacterium]
MTDQKKTPSGGDRKGVEKYRHAHRTNSRLFPQDIAIAFKAALDKAGLSTKDKITADGKLHRFTIQSDRAGSKNGWYVLYGDGLPAGSFGSWKTGFKGTWCAKAKNTLTAAEREEFRQRMDTARKAREAEEQGRRIAASEKALVIWKASPPAPDNHPYLVKKGVRNLGLRLYKETLVIPMRDSLGNLHSLQFIDGEGNKRFLSGGRKKGCYFAVGVPTESLCIAEGYATAASIHESTGLPVAVAFDAGNLEPVARALRAKFPEIEITLCADNDSKTPGNPGLTKAREAAAACGAFLAVPPCAGDFNDLYRGAGQ